MKGRLPRATKEARMISTESQLGDLWICSFEGTGEGSKVKGEVSWVPSSRLAVELRWKIEFSPIQPSSSNLPSHLEDSVY